MFSLDTAPEDVVRLAGALQDDPQLWPASLQEVVRVRVRAVAQQATQAGDVNLAEEAEDVLASIQEDLEDPDSSQGRAVAALLEATAQAGATVQGGDDEAFQAASRLLEEQPTLRDETVGETIEQMALRLGRTTWGRREDAAQRLKASLWATWAAWQRARRAREGGAKAGLKKRPAEVFVVRGLSYMKQRKWAEAEAALAQARPRWKALYDEEPGRRRFNYALTLMKLGEARFQREKWESAEAVLAEARSRWKELYDDKPGRHRLGYALTLTMLGEARFQREKWESAEKALAEARPRWKELYAEEPGQHRLSYALTLMRLGEARLEREKWESAEKALAEARPRWKELYDEEPGQHRLKYALTLMRLGEARFWREKWESAEAVLAEARPRWKELYDEEPGRHRLPYARTLANLGMTRVRLGRPKKTVKRIYKKALAVTVTALPWKREARLDDERLSSALGHRNDQEDNQVLEVRWIVISLRAQMLAREDWDAARRSLEKGLEEVSRCRAYIPSYAERVRFQRETATHGLLETMQRLSIEARDRETAFRWSGARGHALAELAAPREKREKPLHVQSMNWVVSTTELYDEQLVRWDVSYTGLKTILIVSSGLSSA